MEYISWKWNSSSELFKTPIARGGRPKNQHKMDHSSAAFSVKPSPAKKDRELSCWGISKQGKQEIPCKFSVKVASEYKLVRIFSILF